jgi:hypothetical protein
MVRLAFFVRLVPGSIMGGDINPIDCESNH